MNTYLAHQTLPWGGSGITTKTLDECNLFDLAFMS
jgi:hypothetical protein